MKTNLIFLFAIISSQLWSQTVEYQEIKNQKIADGSVFTRIINKELAAEIVYEDTELIAFVPLRKQARVHYLIVPKKEIHTLNKAEETDALLLGNMLLLAADLAKKFGIDQSGYRIAMNTNEDSGQSVFHIHLHLMGGNSLGPMVDRID